MNLCDPRTIKDIMTAFGLSFRKEFGQNFLTDIGTVEAIAESCAGDNTKTVLEIGAGFGSLTHELALRYENVIALEIDQGLIPLLGYTLSSDKNARVIEADVTKTDLGELLADSFKAGGVAVCANLPYYITTPILLQLLDSRLPFDSITVMVQSEVADRLCAAPGKPEYGSVTAYTGYFGECRRLLDVPAGRFLPPPKVDSAVVRIDLYKEKPVVPKDEKTLFRVIRAAFGQRRKTLPNALSAGFGELSKQAVTEAVTEAGIAANVRGETLSVDDFCRISDRLTEKLSAAEAQK
ncbi:MAG: 16S rRNA (adenine(1518)-N(6)/adenine(1519)-N(6))-dimethyltransferase RsmA [Clostridia bacterium]|nr:16S rRNA (adenine(1518)-N(6)/adenine(1519)-N(6))-dimethyltransferase RsmA [Clostridia bacterium]